MLNNATGFRKVYIACDYTNLRLGINGLSEIVKEYFKLDLFFPGILFLICGRRSDRIKGLVWEIPVEKTLQPEISYAKTNSMKLMMSLPDVTTATGLRDYVIPSLLYTTGIRVSELIFIKVKDISLHEPETLLVHGKGNKYRYVPLIKM